MDSTRRVGPQYNEAEKFISTVTKLTRTANSGKGRVLIFKSSRNEILELVQRVYLARK